MSRHWAKIGEAGAVRGMRIMVWIYEHLGSAFFNIALVPVMIFYYLRRRTARRASREYLDRIRNKYPDALPGGPKWLVSLRHFIEFGHSIMNKYLAWTAELPHVTMDMDEQTDLFEVVERKKGCLLVGSHFGNIEFSRGISRRHPDLVINVLLHDKHAEKFAELMAGAEPQSRMHLIQVTELDLALTLRLKDKIARGEWVVIAGDRVPVDVDSKTIEAGFIGAPARFPVGPYVLGAVLQCPVYLLHCYRMGSDHYLGFELFAERLELPRSNRQAYLESLVQRYASALERQVVRSPLQWFNFYDFWDDYRQNESGYASENEKN